MTVRPCWTCRQPATHTLTRDGSIPLDACDNCTRIDRAEAETRGWTITPLPSTTTREEAQLHATADDSYATCPRCKWAGKLREDGTMRRHRESVDMGRFTMAGGLPQQPHGDICKGSGEKPWEPGLPEGYELPKQNKHGGWESVAEAKPDAPEPETPKRVPGTLVDPWTWLRRAGDPYTRNPRP